MGHHYLTGSRGPQRNFSALQKMLSKGQICSWRWSSEHPAERKKSWQQFQRISFCSSRREDNISCWNLQLPASPNSFFPCRTNTLQSSCCTFQPPEHFPSWHSRVLPGTPMEAAPGWKMQGQGFEGSRQDMKLKTGQKKKVILAN